MILTETGEKYNDLLGVKFWSPIFRVKSNFCFLCVLCFQRQPFKFLFYFNEAGVLCCVAVEKLLPYVTIVQILFSFPICKSFIMLKVS